MKNTSEGMNDRKDTSDSKPDTAETRLDGCVCGLSQCAALYRFDCIRVCYSNYTCWSFDYDFDFGVLEKKFLGQEW